MSSKKTLVLGASENPARYSNMAVKKLKAYGHEVIAVGRKKGMIEDTAIETDTAHASGIHTITLYLKATNQVAYYDFILSLKPERIIFNPGAENPELEALAEDAGIKVLEACTLVMLNTRQF